MGSCNKIEDLITHKAVVFYQDSKQEETAVAWFCEIVTESASTSKTH